MRPSSKTGATLPHFKELDGIRGIAALAVFFHHVCFASVRRPGPGVMMMDSLQRLLYNMSAFGDKGVDLFFVLSGFLITSLLLRDRTNSSFYRDFYWKRALRILPLYLLCLVVLLIAVPHSGEYVLLAALFMPNLAYVMHIPALGPFWSLGIEEQFYLAWPTVVRRSSLAQVTGWALGVAIATVLVRLGAAFAGHHDFFLTPFRLDGLAGGALLACREKRRNAEGASLASDWRLLALAIVAGIPLAVVGTWPLPSKWIAFQGASYETGSVLICVGFIGFAIGYAGRRRLALLRSAPLLFFGAISYALYMIHAYVMEIYDKYVGPPQPNHPVAFTMRWVIVLAASTAICLVTRYTVELPAISLRRYVLHRPTPPPEVAEPLIPHEDSALEKPEIGIA